MYPGCKSGRILIITKKETFRKEEGKPKLFEEGKIQNPKAAPKIMATPKRESSEDEPTYVNFKKADPPATPKVF